MALNLAKPAQTPGFAGRRKSWHAPCYMFGTRTITSNAQDNKNKTNRLTHNKNNTAEAQLTDSFGEALPQGFAPYQRENNKTAPRQRPDWLDLHMFTRHRRSRQHQHPKQSVCIQPHTWGFFLEPQSLGNGSTNNNNKPAIIIKKKHAPTLGGELRLPQ